MKRQMMTAVAVCALAFAAGCASTSEPAAAAPGVEQTASTTPAPAVSGMRADYPITAEGATAFIADAETKWAEVSEYVARIQWARATNITFDTMWLESKANAEATELQVQLANQAAKFNDVQVDPVVRRKLNLLRLSLVLPAPNRPGAADELAQITTRLDSTYSTGKFDFKGKPITLDEASLILADSRDPAETDRLWAQVKPFYENLHCYVRARLNARYGDAVQPDHGPIRADLLGNMWSQQWGNIYDLVAPPSGGASSYDLTELLKAADYDATKMVRTGEGFYVSLGLDPLPQTFWERSQITRPRDREVVCHASAWDLDNADDIRIKMCTNVNGDDFYTVHHELGHNYYQRAYKNQPMLFRNGANDGFHEAIGDFVGLSALTPTYLNQIGLLKTTPGAEEDIPFLLKMALDKIAFLPFGLMVDRWRWDVFSGETAPAAYNTAWTADMLQYQGLVQPGPRPAAAFDPGAKYHVPGNTPYTRYFLAAIYQFQFQRAACKQAGWTGPLHRCSVYGNKEVGARFNAMLQMGQSQPWQEAMKAFTGDDGNDASAIADYFAPLNVWLQEQNRGHQCGWSAA